MSRRTKILIGVISAIAIIAVLYWLFLRPKYFAPPAPGPAANVNATLTPLALPSVSVSPAASMPELPDEEKLKSDISRLSAAFAERFGSYSNQGNFENILDLKPLMTEKMKNWIDDFIADNQAARGDASVYFGVTTKSISTDISELDEGAGTAEIIVGTQRREASGSMVDNVKISYQNLKLTFKKVGEEWKVDGAEWK